MEATSQSSQLQFAVSALANAQVSAKFKASIPSIHDVANYLDVLIDIACQRRVADGGDDKFILNDLRVNYDSYCTAKDGMNPLLQNILTAKLFYRLPTLENGTVSILSLAQYLRTRLMTLYMFERLMMYDTSGEKCIHEPDLENFIYDAIAGVPELASLQVNFYPFYVFTAVRRFFFLLDPNKTGRIPLKVLITSKVFSDWMAILPYGHNDLGPAGVLLPARTSGEYILNISTPQPNDQSQSNWFSHTNALRVYSLYLELDIDQNGMLSPFELSSYRGGILTKACIERIFEECITFAGEIDFKMYLDILLCLENRSAAASKRFFFRLLDKHGRGRIGIEEIRYFSQQVSDKIVAAQYDEVNPDNVCDEVFDMINPKNPNYITLDDILKCKLGHIVCSILLDAAALYAYDRREEYKGEPDAEKFDSEEFEV